MPPPGLFARKFIPWCWSSGNNSSSTILLGHSVQQSTNWYFSPRSKRDLLLITLKPFFFFFCCCWCLRIRVCGSWTDRAWCSGFFFYFYVFFFFFLILRRVVQFLLSVALLQFAQWRGTCSADLASLACWCAGENVCLLLVPSNPTGSTCA